MGYAELIETLRALPPEKRTEVFDFVAFLAARCGVPTSAELAAEDWPEADFARLSFMQAMRGMEDEPDLYSPNDLVERWQ
ncbi:MAG: DUF2281 domain-containing protein [Pseudomonadota bacterium]|nr:hypothetical protein [Rhodocyclaceae bacterium]